jgi:hypothetical protein
MLWRDVLADWGVSKLQLKLGFLEMAFEPQDADRKAAWELYVELATRISTQPLPDHLGDDAKALASLYTLFQTTRDLMKRYGPGAIHFTRIGIAVLNRVLRPFLTRWHGVINAATPPSPVTQTEFRKQLELMRQDMLQYARVLALIAEVEELH